MAKDILIVDDERDITDLISDLLEDEGYETRSASNGKEAILEAARRKPDIVLLDIWLGDPEFDGIVVLKELLNVHPDLTVVMMSGHGTVETAVNAMKAGAFDFIEKPFKSDHLLVVIDKASKVIKTRTEIENLKQIAPKEDQYIAKSSSMIAIHNEIKKIAPTNARVIIQGPVGSGKERTAKEIHKLSNRKNEAFITVNCTDFNNEDFEKALYGFHNPDTGVKHLGIVDRAHKGTVCFNEITDLSLDAQGKLLNILGSSTFIRPGTNIRSELDIRVIATTKMNIESLVNLGRFREDLYYRLNISNIKLPPLTNRRDDIEELANSFLKSICSQQNKADCILTEEAIVKLKTAPWKGNIRQLRNVIDWIVTMHATPNEPVEINAKMLPKTILDPDTTDSNDNASPIDNDKIIHMQLKDARNEFEKLYIKSQIQRFSGNISQTANFIGMERSALHRKLKALNLDKESEE